MLNGSSSCCNFSMFKYFNLVCSTETTFHNKHFKFYMYIYTTPPYPVLPLPPSPSRPLDVLKMRPIFPPSRKLVPMYPSTGVQLILKKHENGVHHAGLCGFEGNIILINYNLILNIISGRGYHIVESIFKTDCSFAA